MGHIITKGQLDDAAYWLALEHFTLGVALGGHRDADAARSVLVTPFFGPATFAHCELCRVRVRPTEQARAARRRMEAA